MPIAFLLLNVRPGREEEVLRELQSIREVKEANRVYGVYDTIVKIETENMEKLKETMNNRIKKLEHITSVVSLIVTSA